MNAYDKRNASGYGAILREPRPEVRQVMVWPGVAWPLSYRFFGFFLNVPVTLFAWVMVRVHGPVPAHAPPHPRKVEPVSGIAVSFTDVLAPKAAWQLVEQSSPAGEESILPVPLPVLVTLSVYVAVGAAVANMAVTLLAASIVTVQAPVPVHAPLQPVKVEPVAGTAVKVTVMLTPKGALQRVPQSIPAGVEVMFPAPLMDTLKV